jgi:hypothetical protein
MIKPKRMRWVGAVAGMSDEEYIRCIYYERLMMAALEWAR